MSRRKPEEQTALDQVLKLVEKLSPEDQEILRLAFLEDQKDVRICLERLKDPQTISREELKKQIDQAD